MVIHTVDLKPDEYEVIEYHDSRIPSIAEQFAYAFNRLGRAAAEAAEAMANLRRSHDPIWIIREMPRGWCEPLTTKPEPHHFHLLERHIRSHRRKRR